MIITKKNVNEECTEPKTFGMLLKERIDNSNSSRTSLGRTIGVHRTTVSDYILDKYLPKEEVFHRIHQVFPDKELYDAYFKAVRTQEPRPNKNLIPEVESYNYYKAEDDIANPARDLRPSKSATLNSDRYVMYSIKHTLQYMMKEGLNELCPADFAVYEKIYKELYDKFKED